jgi:hypothetical protein
MADIPLLAGRYLHAAQMAHPFVPQKDVGSHLCCYANTLDQWTLSSSSSPWK